MLILLNLESSLIPGTIIKHCLVNQHLDQHDIFLDIKITKCYTCTCAKTI